ncbi:MAG TPA: efflux transporter outer membrane subunit [Pseudomonadales bacterium]|nr:efflux transporter outer membrane subunit [Pseudomonadales bacterium]
MRIVHGYWSPALAIGVSLAIQACALKDPPAREEIGQQALPGVVVPDAWQGAAGAGKVAEPWLGTFGDPHLEQLVGEAFAYNPDLQLAAARVEEAAANVTAAGGRLGPVVDALGRGGGKLGGDFTGTSGVLLRATWEMDVWGRLRYGRRASEEAYVSAETDLAAARQSLAGTLAKAWFVAIESRLQRDIARQMVSDAQQAVDLAQHRQRIGIGSELDVTLAQQTLQTARDSVNQLDLGYREAVRAVETLTGRYPGAQLEAAQTLAALTDQVPAGLPSELLERRLDVRAAEHRIAAAFSQVEEARAAKLPTITLSGGLSHISSDLFVLDKRDDIVKSIGGTVYLPIFNGDQLTAQVEARTAQQHYAVALWAQTGLRAFTEVEQALSTETSLRDREPILATQVDLAQRALELERVRYNVGSSDMRPVLQQQMQTYVARTALLRVQSERRVQRVNLYLALGGDFGVDAAMAQSASR